MPAELKNDDAIKTCTRLDQRGAGFSAEKISFQPAHLPTFASNQDRSEMTSTSHTSCTSSHLPAQIRLTMANSGPVRLPALFMAATDHQPRGTVGQRESARRLFPTATILLIIIHIVLLRDQNL